MFQQTFSSVRSSAYCAAEGFMSALLWLKAKVCFFSSPNSPPVLSLPLPSPFFSSFLIKAQVHLGCIVQEINQGLQQMLLHEITICIHHISFQFFTVIKKCWWKPVGGSGELSEEPESSVVCAGSAVCCGTPNESQPPRGHSTPQK